MNLTNIIGILASIFTAIFMLPQLIRLVKEKDPKNISLNMLVILLLGVGLWIYYGCLKKDWIIIISNAFSWFINISILILTIKYRNKS